MGMFSKQIRVFLLVAAALQGVINSDTSRAEEATSPPNPAVYLRNDVLSSRFGGASIQELLTRAYQFREQSTQVIVGQDRVAQILEDRLIQYLDSFATGQSGLHALHLLGLPGIGKSALLQQLTNLGINVIRVDAQRFAGTGTTNAVTEFINALQAAITIQNEQNSPLVLIVEELDKIPEITPASANGPETTQPFIGLINEALTDGRITTGRGYGAQVLDLSRTLIVSSMNLSPQFLDDFVKERFGSDRDFYGMTIEDLRNFHDWISENQSARYRILSRLFRTNTVGRIAPNAELMEPLGEAEYRAIIRRILVESLRPSTNATAVARRIEFEFADSLVEFFLARTVFAPSGARETVLRTGGLIEQLKGMASRVSIHSLNSMGQPRRVHFEADPTDATKVRMTITPLVRSGRELTAREPEVISVAYDPSTRSFTRPPGLIVDPAAVRFAGAQAAPSAERERPYTQREIRNARFPEDQRRVAGLADRINETLIGQSLMTTTLESEIRSFLGRPLPIQANPSILVIAGFPGIGKSEMANLASRHSGLPAVQLSLQGFSASSPDSVTAFLGGLQQIIDGAKPRLVNGRFLLILEELDKLFEIDPNNGALMNRPVMGPIKELFDKGYIDQWIASSDGSRQRFRIDIRNAFTMVTMNFATSLFNFQADPRLTSFDDMVRAWRELSRSPEARRATLARIFLPETVSRILPRFQIQRPLERDHYRTIVRNHLLRVVEARFNTGNRNSAQIFVSLSDAYVDYIVNESAIPSEGARNAVLTAQNIISADLEDIVSNIPRSGRRSSARLEATLDYNPETTEVIARESSASESENEIFRKKISLRFPSLRENGRIAQRRMHTAIHEFGHAYTAIRMGLRFQYATAVSLSAGAAGFVSLRDGISRTGNNLVARIYAVLAARAMERVLLSADPNSGSSVFSGSQGATSDMQMATRMLYDLTYELGMNPGGPSMDRNGAGPTGAYAKFADVPAEQVERLGLILRNMENYLVADLTAAHSREWYLAKIEEFARRGGVTEKEFYEVIDYPHPGENNFEFGENFATNNLFPGVMESLPAEAQVMAAFLQGQTQTTAAQNLTAGIDFLAKELETRLNLQAANLASVARNGLVLQRCEALASGAANP